MTSGDKIKDLLLLYRHIEWQYRLSEYTDEALKSIQKSLDLARNELLAEIDIRDFRIPSGRVDMALDELNDMTFGIQAILTQDIQQAAQVAGEASYREYGNIMSFDGRLTNTVGFNFVSVSPEQLRSMVTETPVGGRLLESWVADTFDRHIVDGIKAGLIADMLKGAGTQQVINRLTDSFGLIKKDAEVLARTYIADINNRAAEAVYKANSDIIPYEVWNATLEVSFGSGRGTCLRCAGMDGRKYRIDEPHVRPPLHVKCRCFMVPETLSYRELGLDIGEMKESLRPYTVRGPKREIIEAGQIEGSFQNFLNSRGVKYQKELLGPNRYKLLNDKRIKWDDLVDKKGNVVLLKDLGFSKNYYRENANKAGKAKSFIAAKTISEAEKWAVDNGISDSVDYKKITNVEVANIVNKQLKKLQDKYNLSYNSVKSANRKAGGWIGTPMWVETSIGAGGSTKSVLYVNEGYFGRFSSLAEILKDIKRARKDEWWVAESLEDMVSHEYGHRLTSGNILKAMNKDPLFDLKHSTIFDYENLGEYASMSFPESLAEIFARLQKDGFIKPEWRKLFNEFSEVTI